MVVVFVVVVVVVVVVAAACPLGRGRGGEESEIVNRAVRTPEKCYRVRVQVHDSVNASDPRWGSGFFLVNASASAS